MKYEDFNQIVQKSRERERQKIFVFLFFRYYLCPESYAIYVFIKNTFTVDRVKKENNKRKINKEKQKKKE